MRQDDIEKRRERAEHARQQIARFLADLRGAIERRIADLHRYVRLAEIVALIAEQACRHPGQPIDLTAELAPQIRTFAMWARQKAVQELHEWETEARRQGLSSADINPMAAWDKPPAAAEAEAETGEGAG